MRRDETLKLRDSADASPRQRSWVVFGLMMLCLAAQVAAKPLELPVDLELGPGAISIQLDNATIDVIHQTGASTLRARQESSDEAADVVLEVVSDGAIFIQRTQNDLGKRHLLLELTVDPDVTLQIEGAELDVAVEGVRENPDDRFASEENEKRRAEADRKEQAKSEDADDEDEGDEDEEDEGDEDGEDGDDDDQGEGDEDRQGEGSQESDPDQQGFRMSFSVERSNIQLLEARDLEIRAIDSYVNSSGSNGFLALVLDGGTVEVEEHRGSLSVTSRYSEVWLAETSGNLILAVRGGSVVARRGAGRCEGQAEDALVRLEEWRGAVNLAIEEAEIELIASPGASVVLKSQRSNVLLEEHRGSVEVDLQGGSLKGAGLVGGARLTARDEAEITIYRLSGSVILKAESQVTVRVSEIGGALQAEMTDSLLDLKQARVLQLAAVRSEISVAGIEFVNQLDVAASRLDLDFRSVVRSPRVVLREGSEASVTLKAPCGVTLDSDQAFAPVDISGCQLHTESQARPQSNRRGLDGKSRVTLTAALSDDSSLEVEGQP